MHAMHSCIFWTGHFQNITIHVTSVGVLRQIQKRGLREMVKQITCFQWIFSIAIWQFVLHWIISGFTGKIKIYLGDLFCTSRGKLAFICISKGMGVDSSCSLLPKYLFDLVKAMSSHCLHIHVIYRSEYNVKLRLSISHVPHRLPLQISPNLLHV